MEWCKVCVTFFFFQQVRGHYQSGAVFSVLHQRKDKEWSMITRRRDSWRYRLLAPLLVHLWLHFVRAYTRDDSQAVHTGVSPKENNREEGLKEKHSFVWALIWSVLNHLRGLGTPCRPPPLLLRATWQIIESTLHRHHQKAPISPLPFSLLSLLSLFVGLSLSLRTSPHVFLSFTSWWFLFSSQPVLISFSISLYLPLRFKRFRSFHCTNQVTAIDHVCIVQCRDNQTVADLLFVLSFFIL